MQLVCLAALAGARLCGFAAPAPLNLNVDEAPDGLHVAWLSGSITPAAPFLHYDFQIQASSDLVNWTNSGPVISGGVAATASVPHSLSFPIGGQGFYRLSYRFNFPGGDLSGQDLAGVNLVGANLAGAALTNANLAGANLTRANLAGANLAGANLTGAILTDVNLDGLDLRNVDLSQIRGRPVLTQVTGDPAGDAASLLPHLGYTALLEDYVADDPNLPGIGLSVRNAMILLKTNVTVGQLNGLLSKYTASIVASSPKDAFLSKGHLLVRLPTQNPLVLFDLTRVLLGEPIIETAAPDILLGPAALPNDGTGVSGNWVWGLTPFGGNWGLEYARVPQMWNLNEALKKLAVSPVRTSVLDGPFRLDHQDLRISDVLGPPDPIPDDHGMHVAGIIGATFNNTNGIDGVNPFADVVGYTLVLRPNDGGKLLALDSLAALGYRFVEDLRLLLFRVPDTRIVNTSLAFNWSLNKGWSSPPTGTNLSIVAGIAEAYGSVFAEIAHSVENSVLFVCAAGNDSNLIPARFSSPMCNAALDFGAPNVLVVGSHGPGGAISSFSNLGGQVAAPGEDILSTAYSDPNAYTNLSGTSMASPFVAGLAGYLLAVDSSLTPATLIDLIRRNGQNVDAFRSLMEIDTLGKGRPVLKMLLDIDDGSPDGNLRVAVPKPVLSRDRTFEPITGPDILDDDLDGDEGLGNGVVDMGDFRRWRDWLLFGEGNSALNGSSTHPKNDVNRDGRVEAIHVSELNSYPRGDFNGDGFMSRIAPFPVPGWLGNTPTTDLGVLISSGLWSDSYYDALDLPNLIDSADISVSATNFFYKDPEVQEGEVSVYDAQTGQEVGPGKPFLFTPDKDLHIFTVPVGGKYFVASKPIPLPTGINVMMRSMALSPLDKNAAPTDFEIPLSARGADYAVDLTLMEMTATADVENPSLHAIASHPDQRVVDAHEPAAAPASDSGTNTVGARGWANDQATLYAIANACSLDVPPTNSALPPTFSAQVRWQRGFFKDSRLPDPKFLIQPIILRLSGTRPPGIEWSAFAEISIEMRAYDISPVWQPVFFYHAKIAGESGNGGAPSTFHIEFQEGDLTNSTLRLDGNAGAEYDQPAHAGKIDLHAVLDGHSFEVRYRLSAIAAGTGNDSIALAYVGDPLHYGSGFRMAYGGFGELPAIDSFTIDPQNAGHVAFVSRTNFYYLLYRAANGAPTGPPIVIKLGTGGPDELIDPTPPVGANAGAYVLENQPIDQPLDSDGDGIDDVYELVHGSFLDPLNPADALQDQDGDGFTNLAEYQRGTDPTVPDTLPPSTPGLYPGSVVNVGPGLFLRAADLNNDGLMDLVNLDFAGSAATLGAALAGTNRTFFPAIASPLLGSGVVPDFSLAKMDSDNFVDAIVLDDNAKQLRIYRGLGNGQFELLTNFGTINAPISAAVGDLNGDGKPDLVAIDNTTATLVPILSQPAGGWLASPPMLLSGFQRPYTGAVADFDGDGTNDLALGSDSSTAIVLLGRGDGTFKSTNAWTVGTGPRRIAVGDVNGDGLPDIVTANLTSEDVSVLVGHGDGTFDAEKHFKVGVSPRELVLRDVNGDGKPDLIVVNNGSDFYSILLNLGSGNFAPQMPAYTAANVNDHVVTFDWNGDGHEDIVALANDGQALIIGGRGDGTFDTRTEFAIGTGPKSGTLKKVLAVDLNGDQIPELLALNGLNQSSNTLDILQYSPTGAVYSTVLSLPLDTQAQGFVVQDLNSDGKLDIAVAGGAVSPTLGTNQMTLFFGNGGFSFSAPVKIPLSVLPNDVVAGDINGDGHTDLLVVNFGTGTVVPLTGDGTGAFQNGSPAKIADFVSVGALINVDTDTNAEFVASGVQGNTAFLKVFKFGTNSLWTELQSLSSGSDLPVWTIRDLTGDALPDLVVFDPVLAEVGLFPRSAGGFGARQTLLTGITSAQQLQVADLDHDGHTDLVVGSSFYLAKSAGGYNDPQPIWIGPGGPRLALDLNGDQKSDLLTWDQFAGTIAVLFAR